VVDEENNFMLEEEKFRPIKFEHIIEMVEEIEGTFTAYLTVKQYQWSSPTYREIFMKQLTEITNLHILKEHIKALQESFLFAEYAVPDVPRKKME
jgi:hypothetical protein